MSNCKFEYRGQESNALKLHEKLAFFDWLFSVKSSLEETFVCQTARLTRWRLQERHKFTNLKNSSFSRFVQAIFTFVHFAFVCVISTTTNHLLCNFQFFSSSSSTSFFLIFFFVIAFISSQTIGRVEKLLQ